jgi:hypothetical protein
VNVRVFSFAVIAGLTALPMATLSACKGGGQANAPVNVPPADGGPDAHAPSVFATTPPPSGLPPMASVPPPGVAGSKKAKVKDDAALTECGGKEASHAKDPAALVKKIGDACAAPSKMKPIGAPLKGTQADREPHQENKLHVEANHCYRVYFAADDGVKDVVATLRDSNGDVITSAPGPAAPQFGAMCFSAADDVTLSIGVGAGKGTWAAQVWGN